MTASASILPNGRKQYLDGNGKPLAGASVWFYVPGTTTLKTTWLDSGQAVQNTNPVILDPSGTCVVFGSGSYREYVTDALGNLISDSVTVDVTAVLLADIAAINLLLPIACTAVGTNSIALTPVGLTVTAYADQQMISFFATSTSTGAVSINLAGIGVRPLYNPGGIVQCAAADIVAGGAYVALYHASAGVAVLISQPAAQTSATITALRASNFAQPQCLVLGYSVAQDGGGGTFSYVSTDTTSADNGGTIIVDSVGRRWYRVGATGALQLSWFGGGTTAADNSASWAAAVAAGGSAVRIHFPRGTYVFSGGVAATLPTATASISVTGDGPNLSLLRFTAGGIVINLISPNNSFSVRDMSILTDGVGSSTGLNIIQTAASITNPAESQLSDVTNVNFRGSDGLAGTKYFINAIAVNKASCINFVNVFATGAATPAGVGVALVGTASVIPVLFNFTGCVFNDLNVGIYYGNYVQGVSVSQSNFTFDNFGILVPAGEVALAQLAVLGSQFNCYTCAIQTLSNPPGATISDNFILVPNNAIGIQMTNAGLFNISGNTFFGINSTGTVGIEIVSSSAFGVITGNPFVGMASVGIKLDAGSSNVNVQSNSYQSCGTNVSNLGTLNVIGGGSP